MVTNRQIKRLEIYKANQQLIKVLGDFKKAQQDYLLATNQLALDELDKPNALVKGAHSFTFKQAVKRYINLYGKKVGLEREITALKNWQPKEE